MLSALYHRGWIFVFGTDITKKVQDKDTLFFRPGPLPSPCDFFAISFNEGDKLRLIGAPPATINAVKQAVAPLLQDQKWKVQDIAYQFKFKG